MTDHNDIGAAASSWSYEIQYGPNDEEIYAWVYNHSLMVCTVKMHHARMIVQAVNAYEPLKARLAEVERERDEVLKRYTEAEKEWEYDCSQRANDIKRALVAEARVAVLEEVLKNSYFHMFDGPEREAVRTALAAEQKESGK